MVKFLKKLYDGLELQDASLRFIIFFYLYFGLTHLAFLYWSHIYKFYLYFIHPVFALMYTGWSHVSEFYLSFIHPIFALVHTSWFDIIKEPTFLVTFCTGIFLILVLACTIVINSKLISRRNKRIIRHFFFYFLVLLAFLIFAWLIMHVSTQLDFFCQSCQENSKHWLFTLLASISLYFITVASLSILGIKYKAVNQWSKKIEAHFFKFAREIKKIYLNPKMVIPFILFLIAILSIILIAGYWVDNSRTPRIKSSHCETGHANCLPLSLDNTNTTDSKSIQLEAETNILRNKWLWIFGLIALGLTVWGRIIEHKEYKQTQKQIDINVQELKSTGEQTQQQIELTRQANIDKRIQGAFELAREISVSKRASGVQLLTQITNDYESTLRILSMLIFFLKNPVLDEESEQQLEKEERQWEKNSDDEEREELESYEVGLMKLFPVDELLPKDILEAANSISEIYKKIHNTPNDIQKELGKEIISLPLYFLRNQKSKSLFFPGINLSEKYLKKAYLPSSNFAFSKLRKANLIDAELRGANFEKAKLEYANLENADLNRVNLQGAELSNANLKNAKFWFANLQKANLSDAKLEGARLEQVNLQAANLSNSSMKNVSLEEANLQHANLHGVNLESANLNKANLQGVALQNAILQNANLADAILQEANLHNANLYRADLTNINLQNSNLSNTNLEYTVLDDAKLKGSNLSGASLEYTQGFRSDFRNAKIINATLKNANLAGANFSGVNLSEADITSASLERVKNLTTKQILSAKWGIDNSNEGTPPILPGEFMEYDDIKKWCKEPHYNHSRVD